MAKEIEIIEDKAKSIKREWEDYARKGNWTVKGYEILKATAGPGKIEEAKEAEFMVIYRPHGVLYHHSYGLVSKFFKGLIDKKLFGTKCSRCGTVYCPPRVHCWNPLCRVAETEWLELPQRGRVHTFSVMLFSADAFLEMLPFVLSYVQVDGTHTALPTQIVASPTEVFIGQEVEIRFREISRGDLMDIYAVPIDGQTIPEGCCLHKDLKNIEDLRRDLESTYAFLQKRFGIKKEEVERRWRREQL